MNKIQVKDFHYLCAGKSIAVLTDQEAHLLKTIEKHGVHKNKVLLVLHGFASTPSVYRELLPLISSYDAVICPVLPGHCLSIEAFAKTNAQQWVQAAESLCNTLMSDYQQVDVLGLSLGGVLACHLSRLFPIHHLFLLAPALKLRLNMTLALLGARCLRYLGFKSLLNRGGNIHTEGFHELTYHRLPLTTIIEILMFIKNFEFKLPTCPTDVFLGRFDAVIDSIYVENLFANDSIAKIHWLEHSAHVLPLDGDIKAMVDCINQLDTASQ